MEKPFYRCSHSEFYLAVQLIIISLEEDLARFHNLKPKYTPAFITNLKTQLQNAEKMSDKEQRTEPVKRLRTTLMLKAKKECTPQLKTLKAYINDAYTNPKDIPSALQEAGFNLFTAATHQNWESLKAIMLKANTFIEKNTTLLSENENMPPDFPAVFLALTNSTISNIDIFLEKKAHIKLHTSFKNKANNALYKAIMKICSDAKVVWINDEVRLQNYIWERVLKVITPPGAASLQGTVKADQSFLPVENAQITMQSQGSPPITFSTNDVGKYNSGNLPAAEYRLTITAPGFRNIETTLRINLGRRSYKYWLLTPLNSNPTTESS